MTLSIAEIEAHPAFPNVISLPPPERKGKVTVAHGRGGPFNIAYEIYGTGPVHLVWIMGMGAPKIAWHRQTIYFGIDRANVYSSLVLDNRGFGDSDKPLIRYSTSEMARDVLEVLEHIGWTQERSIHLTGVSMGGMISMELAHLAPHLLASLTLQSTAASLNNPIPWYQELYNRLSMFMPKSLEVRLRHVQEALFSPSWLSSPDPTGVFPTNGDRFVAEELWRLKNITQGSWTNRLLQGLAATGHHFSNERLKKLGELVKLGETRDGEEGAEQKTKKGLEVPVMVYTGKLDKLIEWSHSKLIVEGIEAAGKGKTRLKVWDGSGHVLHWENLEEYNRMQEEYFREAEEKLGRGEVFHRI